MSTTIDPTVLRRLHKTFNLIAAGQTAGERSAAAECFAEMLAKAGIHPSELRFADPTFASAADVLDRFTFEQKAAADAQVRAAAALADVAMAQATLREQQAKFKQQQKKFKEEQQQQQTKPAAWKDYSNATMIDTTTASDESLTELGRRYVRDVVVGRSRTAVGAELPFGIIVQESLRRYKEITGAKPSQKEWLAKQFGVTTNGQGCSVRWCYLCQEASMIVRGDDWPTIFERFSDGQPVSARTIVQWRKQFETEKQEQPPKKKKQTATEKLNHLGSVIEQATSLEEVREAWQAIKTNAE